MTNTTPAPTAPTGRTAAGRTAAGPARRLPRRRRFAVLALAVPVLLAACGGRSDLEAGVDAGLAAGENAAGPAAQGPGGDVDGNAGGFADAPANCPAHQEVFEAMNRATYQVFGEFVVAGEADPRYIPIGTAWAIDDRVLVTNGHVAEAYEGIAESGLQLSRAVAVQAGTGKVVELLRALVHPDYTGDPLGSPDVALLTTKEVVPSVLTLAADYAPIAAGDTILLSGFPGDVDEHITAIPGLTVPQATSLTGSVTALRSYDRTAEVTAANLDVLQHQAPTTPGTSGSAITACGEVIAVNNAGTVRLVLTPDEDGEVAVERQAAASNNFGVHARHVRALLDLFDADAVQGFAVPVAAAPSADAGPRMDQPAEGAESIVVAGQVTDPAAAHSFVIEVHADGSITGTSSWAATGEFTLVGQVEADGTVVFVDDAPERLGFRRGTYEGVITSDTSIEGVYYEQSQEGSQWGWAAHVV